MLQIRLITEIKSILRHSETHYLIISLETLVVGRDLGVLVTRDHSGLGGCI